MSPPPTPGASGTEILIRLIDDYRAEIAALRVELAAARAETAAALRQLQEGQTAHRERSEPLLSLIEREQRAQAARAERGAPLDRLADALIPVLSDWRVVLAALGALSAAAGLEIGDILRAILSPGVAP